MLVWRLLQNRLPTKDNLVRRQVIPTTDTDCITGCGGLETSAHLFLHWHIQISMAPCMVLVTYFYGAPGNIRQHFIQFTSMAGLPRFTNIFMKVIWCASVWVIWKERNKCVFQNTTTTPSVLVEQVKLNSFLWLRSKQLNFAYSYHEWWQNPTLCMGLQL